MTKIRKEEERLMRKKESAEYKNIAIRTIKAKLVGINLLMGERWFQ